MKFKRLYNFNYIINLGVLSCFFGALLNTKTPVKTHVSYKETYIKITTDTVIITDNMLRNKEIIASGTFFAKQGIITLKYFKTYSDRQKTKYFCEYNNSQTRLVLRHETEHARKANLTKNTWMYPPITRGFIAAHNEIVAPAAEIIEALDYKYETGQSFPTNKAFIKKAEEQITKITTKQKLNWPLDFNNPQIADIIIECATERFLEEVKRGLYTTTIKKEIEQRKIEKYETNNLCNQLAIFLFRPEENNWTAMWQLESQRGSVNLWDSASQKQKQKLTDSIAVIITNITGQKYYFLQNKKTH